MKFSVRIIFFLLACAVTGPAQKALPQFEDYPAAVYKGKIHQPKWIKQSGEDEWRDDLGKLVDEPGINYAGKYFITEHSCGTVCTYFSITDLSTGRELNVLDQFSYGEPPPKTPDGYAYTTDMIFRPGSRMLVVQYNVELKHRNEECRERIFSLENGKLKPLTKIRRGCQ